LTTRETACSEKPNPFLFDERIVVAPRFEERPGSRREVLRPFGGVAQNGPGHVDRNVAAPDHNHPRSDLDLIAEIGVQQKVDAIDDAVKMRTRNAQVASACGAEREEDGGVPAVPKLGHGEIPPESSTDVDLDAQADDTVDLGTNDVARQAVLGNALIQHATQNRRGVEHRDAVAKKSQIVCARQTGRPGADHGNARGLPIHLHRHATTQ